MRDPLLTEHGRTIPQKVAHSKTMGENETLALAEAKPMREFPIERSEHFNRKLPEDDFERLFHEHAGLIGNLCVDLPSNA